MPRSYPPEFRRKVLDLLRAGRSVTEVAADLGVSGPCIYNWRKQDRIDRGEAPGLSTSELSELTLARRRIVALEAELAATKRAKELLKEAVSPKGRFAITAVMAKEGHSIKVTCRVLRFSPQAFYQWRKHPVSTRDWDDAHLINAALAVHADDPVFGYRFIADELAACHGITASENRVHRLCRQHRIASVIARRRGVA